MDGPNGPLRGDRRYKNDSRISFQRRIADSQTRPVQDLRFVHDSVVPGQVPK